MLLRQLFVDLVYNSKPSRIFDTNNINDMIGLVNTRAIIDDNNNNRNKNNQKNRRR